MKPLDDWNKNRIRVFNTKIGKPKKNWNPKKHLHMRWKQLRRMEHNRRNYMLSRLINHYVCCVVWRMEHATLLNGRDAFQFFFCLFCCCFSIIQSKMIIFFCFFFVSRIRIKQELWKERFQRIRISVDVSRIDCLWYDWLNSGWNSMQLPEWIARSRDFRTNTLLLTVSMIDYHSDSSWFCILKSITNGFKFGIGGHSFLFQLRKWDFCPEVAHCLNRIPISHRVHFRSRDSLHSYREDLFSIFDRVGRGDRDEQNKTKKSFEKCYGISNFG